MGHRRGSEGSGRMVHSGMTTGCREVAIMEQDVRARVAIRTEGEDACAM